VDLVVATDHMLAQHESIAATNIGDNFGDYFLVKSAMISKVIPVGVDAISKCSEANRDFPAYLNKRFGAGRVDAQCSKPIR
jgi:hypothetical protein